MPDLATLDALRAQGWVGQVADRIVPRDRLRVDFITPMRLIDNEQLDVNALSPLEALNKLFEWKKQVK